jgi:hypothetical protein
MYSSLERFRKEVGWVLNTRDVMDVNYATIDAVTNEMGSNVNMFHTGMRMRVVGACDGALIVTEKNGRISLGKTKFVKKRTEPNDLSGAVCARNVFRFTG